MQPQKRPPIFCYKCKKPGHMAGQCSTATKPDKQKNPTATKSDKHKNGKYCSLCQKPGHTNSTCYSKFGGPQPAAPATRRAGSPARQPVPQTKKHPTKVPICSTS